MHAAAAARYVLLPTAAVDIAQVALAAEWLSARILSPDLHLRRSHLLVYCLVYSAQSDPHSSAESSISVPVTILDTKYLSETRAVSTSTHSGSEYRSGLNRP